MPTNSDYDGYFYAIGDVPVFVYGMITATVVVLAYMTAMETDLPDEVPVPPIPPVENPLDIVSQNILPNSEGTPEGPPESDSIIQEELPQQDTEQLSQEPIIQEEPQNISQEIPQEENRNPVGGKKKGTRRKRPKN
jgi:hypothetical protein